MTPRTKIPLMLATVLYAVVIGYVMLWPWPPAEAQPTDPPPVLVTAETVIMAPEAPIAPAEPGRPVATEYWTDRPAVLHEFVTRPDRSLATLEKVLRANRQYATAQAFEAALLDWRRTSDPLIDRTLREISTQIDMTDPAGRAKARELIRQLQQITGD